MHLVLVDGSSYIFRAFHALPQLTRKSDGLPVGCVSGFCNMLWKLTEDLKGEDEPTHMAVIFDYSSTTFRDQIYAEYKMQRPPAPEELVPQFPLTRAATRAYGLPSIEMEGFEADDIIATYACMARDAGGKVTIVVLRQGPDAAGRARRLDPHARHHPAPRPAAAALDRGGRGVREVRRRARQGDRGAGAVRRRGRQRAGRPRHRGEDRGRADQHLWRHRDAARAAPPRSSSPSAGRCSRSMPSSPASRRSW